MNNRKIEAHESCINCKHAKRPTQRSACNHKVKLIEVQDITPFLYHENGDSYCQDYKKSKGGRYGR